MKQQRSFVWTGAGREEAQLWLMMYGTVITTSKYELCSCHQQRDIWNCWNWVASFEHLCLAALCQLMFLFSCQVTVFVTLTK